MDIITPLTITKTDKSCGLPIQLFNNDGVVIKIEKFSIKEKEEIFELKDLKIIDEKKDDEQSNFRCSGASNHVYVSEYRDEILAPYKVVISSETDNPAFLQKYLNNVDFAFRVICGCGLLRIYKLVCPGLMFHNLVSRSNKWVVSRRERTLDGKNIGKIKVLISALNKKDQSAQIIDKTNLLRFLLETAMFQVPNRGMSGALYISILESLFAPEKDSEIGYRLSMRLTKKRGRDNGYRKKIKDLYGKRSVMFHSGHDQFVKEDLGFLEEESCWAMEEFLKNPDDFLQHEKLDELLLGSC